MTKDKKYLNFDYDDMIDYSQELFYHGTSDSLNLSVLLPPSLIGRLKEYLRQKTLNKVFLTNSLKPTQMYAKKRIEKNSKKIGDSFKSPYIEARKAKTILLMQLTMLKREETLLINKKEKNYEQLSYRRSFGRN